MDKLVETSQAFESNLEAANKELDLSKDQIEVMTHLTESFIIIL